MEIFSNEFRRRVSIEGIPEYEEGWQPVLDVLSQGEFFVTTGEVLIPEFTVQGFDSGDTIPPGTDLRRLAIEMKLEWTYPLSHLTIVSGDGEQVYRHHIDLGETTEFGSMPMQLESDLDGRSWVRLEVWDIARNGAFTQPVWIESRN